MVSITTQGCLALVQTSIQKIDRLDELVAGDADESN